jgi:hypothetical protein
LETVSKIGISLRSASATASFLLICLFSFTTICTAADSDLEKSVNESLAQAKAIVDTMKAKLAQGASVEAELSRLKKTAEEIKINDLLLEERFTVREEQAKALVDKLAGGQWTHDYGLTATEAQSMGLNVKTGIPSSILDLMRLYPQPVRQLPSIEFLPHVPTKRAA